ncbi:MAG: acetylxylan esterase [Planctomycetes bacterium]|nr:acetylxylan esterase [Planctomycetota bacterium]
MKPLVRLLSLLLLATTARAADDPLRVISSNEWPRDARLGRAKTLNDYFPMDVPASKEAWETRRKALREQVLVANGLWPMPEKTPLHAVIHGKIDRDDYTIEKIFFASYPGHYVTGNLYRPKKARDKVPGVLCPHGHWNNGRFYQANEGEVQAQLKQGAEQTAEGARFPLQARCAMLARLGCVVFHYDMVGVADSKQIGHRAGFTDAEAELRLQSFMGLQTWNSIRALDFLLSLPEVDARRIGVTGASGGGTQTFMLCAVDDRPAVAFPAVMVSTAMQGGCICENCSYLRQNAGNIDLAGLFAPKPLAMSGANDWTIDIETKGLPELKALYKLYGAEDRVLAKCFPQFGHNYNQVSREVMYNWFNKHLGLGEKEPVTEKPFKPVPPKELSVFDAEYPLPKDAVGADGLRKFMTEKSEEQITALLPKDADSLRAYRRVIGTALRVMAGGELPETSQVEMTPVGDKEVHDGVTWRRFLLGRKGGRDAVPAVGLRGEDFDGTVVVWIHPKGKASLVQDGKLVPQARKILDAKAGILAPDVFWTGEAKGVVVVVRPDAKKLQAHNLTPAKVEQAIAKAKTKAIALGNLAFLLPKDGAAEVSQAIRKVVVSDAGQPVFVNDVAELAPRDTLPVSEGYAGYTYGYNRPLLANRVHDILTAVACARAHEKTKKVDLVGFDSAGPWVLLARPLCGDAVARTAADVDGFRFDRVRRTDDEMMLPGALKYGGLPALAALTAPGELLTHNQRGTGSGRWLKAVYKAAKAADRAQESGTKLSAAKVVDWLLR